MIDATTGAPAWLLDDVVTALNDGELQHATPEIRSRVRAWPDLVSDGPLTGRKDAITVADLCGIGAEDAAIAAAALRGINLP
jgi:ornithine cyclodeaminase/alanine dehydrogenase-like protein (mu-crystallin family)